MKLNSNKFLTSKNDSLLNVCIFNTSFVNFYNLLFLMTQATNSFCFKEKQV